MGDLAGKKVDVMENPDEIICNIVGEAMKHVLSPPANRESPISCPKLTGANSASRTWKGSTAGRRTKIAAKRTWHNPPLNGITLLPYGVSRIGFTPPIPSRYGLRVDGRGRLLHNGRSFL